MSFDTTNDEPNKPVTSTNVPSPSRKRGSIKMKTYLVTAALKYPGYYHTGYEFEIIANNKQQAISRARKDAAREGHTKQDGPLLYTAQEI